MPREIIHFEKNELHFGTLLLQNNSIKFQKLTHTCNTQHPSGLVYDQSHRRVFYLSSDRSTIFHDRVSQPCQTVVSGRTNIVHMVIDYEFENVYWIEGTDLHVISVVSGRERVLRRFDESFRSMMIDPVESYVGLVGEKCVYKVDSDGTRIETLYENLNISRVFLDADGSPIYLANDSLISCPTMGAPMEFCITLNISTTNRLLLGVFMNFVLLINANGSLEIVSENSRQGFSIPINHSDDSLFEVIQAHRTVNSTHLCNSCEDICLNSGTTIERCRCGDQPCGENATAVVGAVISLICWEVLLLVIITIAMVVFLVQMVKQLKNAKNVLCAPDAVGFDSTNDNIIIESPETLTPCIGVSMKAQLIENR